MAESLESRKHERKSTFDVPLPMRRKDRDTNPMNESWADESTNAAPTGTMAFSLLTKRGNRQQVSIQLPFHYSMTDVSSVRPAQLNFPPIPRLQSQ